MSCFALLIILSWRSWRNCRYRKRALNSPFYLKAGQNISHEKGALPYQQDFLSPQTGADVEMDGYKVIYQNNPDLIVDSSTYFLVTFPQFTAPTSNPFVFPLIHKFIISIFKKYIPDCFLWSSFSSGRLPWVHKRLLNKMCMIFSCYWSFNSQAQRQNLTVFIPYSNETLKTDNP